MSTKVKNPTVAKLEWALTGLAITFWFSRNDVWFGLRILLGVVLASVAIPWVFGPFLLRFSHRMSRQPEFVPFDLDDPETSDETRESIRDAEAMLSPLGFERVKNYRLDTLVRNASGFTAYFRNPSTGEAAKLNQAASRGGVVKIKALTIVLTTLHADDTEITTSDSRTNLLMPPYGPPVISMAFPQVRDASVLYAIHQARVQDMALAARRVDAIGNDPDAFLRRTEYRSIGRWIERGYFEPIGDGRKIRPTWKGAILMTWKEVWPSKPIRQAWKRYKAAREIRRLGIDLRGGAIADPFQDSLSR